MKSSSLDFLHKVIQEVARFDLTDDVELTTAHYALLVHAKCINPNLRTGTFFNPPPDWMPLRLAHQHALDWAKLFEIQVAHLNIALITTEFVEQLHSAGLIAYGSNLETEEEMSVGLAHGLDAFSTANLKTALALPRA